MVGFGPHHEVAVHKLLWCLMKVIPHPIPYQGSKRQLAPHILAYFPDNVRRLVEPFAGSAALSIAAAAGDKVMGYLINDLNQTLIELLEQIVEMPESIAEAYAALWYQQAGISTIEHYYQVREKFNQRPQADLFLYLLVRCVKGAVRYNASGEFNQSPDKRRCGTKPETMRKHIKGMSLLLQGKCEFSVQDYRVLLAAVTTEDLVYLDPPYQGVCGEKDNRYFAKIDHEGFIDALAELNGRGISYLVSYDGRCGNKVFGKELPSYLDLQLVELQAGRSSQSTLLGRNDVTVESLYLSPALRERLSNQVKDMRLMPKLTPVMRGTQPCLWQCLEHSHV